MNFIASFFNKPFPSIQLPKQKLIISFLFGVFVFVFLAIFKPFEIDDITDYVHLYLAGFGVITSLTMLIAYFLVPLVVPDFFNPDTWNIGKTLLLIIGILSAISFGNWLYNSIFFEGISSQHSLGHFVFITVSVGIFPVIFLIFFIELYLNRANQSLAQSVDEKIHQLNPESTTLHLKGENKNESLNINVNQLICVKSDGNYVTVYFKEAEGIKKKMIRNTISGMESQFAQLDKVYRCHRSYIVNLESVKSVTGNARNFNLWIDGLDFSIPVSRSFPKSILESIAK